MDENELIKKLVDKKISINKLYHIKNIKLFFNRVIEFNNKYFIDNSIKYSQMLYNYINNIKYHKICMNESCNNKCVYFKNFYIGYTSFCSNKCISSSKIIKDKKIETLKKYGVENPFQLDKVKEKTKQTNLKRYGVEYASQNKEIKEKIKKTNLKRYGVRNLLQSKEIKEKIKQTNLKRYGVEYPSKSKIIKEKTKQTNLKRYGVDNAMKNNFIREKLKKTLLKKYGVEYPIQNKGIKKKIKQTNLERYGVEFPLQNKNIINKIKQTNLNKYGVDSYSKSNESKKERYTKTINLFSIKLNLQINNILYEGINNKFLIKNYCKKHLDGFEISYRNLLNRTNYEIKNICTICNPISKQSSIKEKEIVDFIKNKLNITNLIENDRIVLNGKELDIYLPDHNLAIEFNGLYYHSDKFKENNYHLNKTNLCELKGIQLLHIFEDEWVYKSDIIKSIIKNKLQLLDNKINSSECIIKEISSKDSKEFLNENHIQGNLNSSIRLGLFYENELVSLMTFRKKYSSNQYNLNRFCNKLNTNLIGYPNKLFEYFLNKYEPEEVISYADRRFDNGGIYEKLGLKLDSIDKPNYWYFKNGNLVRNNKSNLRKEGHIENIFYNIYDCGNFKYLWNK